MGDIVRLVRKEKFLGWYIRYKDVDGRRRMRASHQPTRELARRYLLAIEARVARGVVGIPEAAPSAPTVAELADRFLTEYSRPRIKDMTAYRFNASKALRRALLTIGDLPSDSVQSSDFAQVRDSMACDFAPSSVKVSLAFLSKMYGWAVQQGIVIKNPVSGVERPTPDSSIDYLDRDEITALLRLAWEHAPKGLEDLRLATAIELALRVGLRKGELLGLRWSDVDLDTRRLTIARSFESTPKSGKARHLRLPSACVAPLREWRRLSPRNPAGLLFAGPGGRCYSTHALLGLPALLAAAGCRVPAHPWHALRHTFASHYVMQGGNILTLQRILGHADIKMTLLYAHLAPDFLSDELDRLQF